MLTWRVYMDHTNAYVHMYIFIYASKYIQWIHLNLQIGRFVEVNMYVPMYVFICIEMARTHLASSLDSGFSVWPTGNLPMLILRSFPYCFNRNSTLLKNAERLCVLFLWLYYAF